MKNVQMIASKGNGLNVIYAICALLIIFFIWAFLSEISQHVKGYGQIIPSGKTRTIQHLEGGIISEIFVSEGDKVEKGQPLFTINSLIANTEQNEAKIKLHELESRFIRLQAQQKNQDELIFPLHLKENYPDIIQAETDLFRSQQQEFKERVRGFEDQINQKKLKLESLANTRANLQSELAVAIKQRDLNEKLYSVGSVSQSKYLDAESRVGNFKTRISGIKREIPVVRAEQAEIKSKLAQAYNEYESDILEEMNKTSFEKKQITERIEKLSDKVARSNVVSPVDGILNVRYFDTIGGVVNAGGTMAEIAPMNEQLIVEGRISTENRPKIYIGLPVNIRSSAYDFKKNSVIKGKLTSIGADSITDQQGVQYYKITAVIDSDGIPDDIEIFSGMVVDMNIVIGHVTVLQAILKPFLDIKNNALR